MTTYIERYKNGEHERVWGELHQLGAKVRGENIFPDALEVARETMSRVRQNLEILIGRLAQIGFVFGYDHRFRHMFLPPFTPDQQDHYLHAWNWVRQQPPVFAVVQPGSDERETEDTFGHEDEVSSWYDDVEDAFGHEDEVSSWYDDVREGQHLGDEITIPAFSTPLARYLNEIEQLTGPMALSARAWYEIVGTVNLYGYHEGWSTHLRSFYDNPRIASYIAGALMSMCDPLQVAPIDEAFLATVRRLSSQAPVVPIAFEFAPDGHGKDYRSTSGTPYIFSFPDPQADAMLRRTSPQGLVPYLRQCFAWGGFPGMAQWPSVPKDDLEFLTHDLVAF